MRSKCLLVLLCLVLSGCYVQSLHVFYTDDTKTDFPELMGEWQPEIQMGKSVANKQITPWTFTTKTVDTYDQNNIYSELEVVYFKLGDTYFMDFTAGLPIKGRETIGNLFWSAGLIPVHSLCKLQIKENKLTIIPLDFEWFSERIKEGTLNLPYIKRKSDNTIFTATPEEWITFLKKYKDDQDVFNPEYKFVFRKAGH